MTLGELAAIERVAPPSMTRIAAKLVDEGLISRRAEAADRRVVWVELTAAGREQLEVTRDKHTEWLAGRLRDCTASELACLHDAAALLERLVDDEQRP
jgi:DNA-binding MarR family transcriptional regulator